MAGSPKSRRTPNTRKPVTIDLEAKPAKGDERSIDESPIASDTPEKSSASDASPGSISEKPHKPEPVAFDELADKPADGKPGDKPSAQTGAAKTSGASNKTAPKKDEPKRSAAPVSSGGKSGSGSSAITGGVIGGVVALVIFGGLQWAGVLPSAGDAPTETTDTTLLETEIAGLKEQIANLEAGAGSGELPPDIAEQLSAASSASQEATTSVSNIEQSVASLSEQVSALEAAISDGGGGANGEASAALGEQLSGLSETVSGLETTLSEQGEQLAAIETRVSEVEELAAEDGSNADVATAIASAGLKSAIDRGGSFMAELEAFATVSDKTDLIEGLRDYAAAGVPTVNQLSDRFPDVANRIVAAGQGLSDDAGIADRLMQSARSLVQVRPVGEVEGETPGAIAARIETRLKSGDLSSALQQWETLPDAAKNVSSDFADQMRARRSVDAMVAEALTGAMTATTTN